MKIAVIYGGTRQDGKIEIITERVVEGLSVERIYLKDYKIQPIEDFRHSKSGFHTVDDNYNEIIDRIVPHDILIFATPIYWYGMSGTLKNFIDRWSQTLKDSQYPNFKTTMATKRACVIAVGGDEPSLKGLPLIQQFQYIFNFIGISFDEYIIAKGDKPREVLQDKSALFDANQMKKRLKIKISEEDKMNGFWSAETKELP